MTGILRAGALLAVLALLAGCEGGTGSAAGPLPASSGELTGKLLVAAPRMPDHRFAGTLVLVVHHSERGAMGLVVNRAIGRASIAEILRRTRNGRTSGAGKVELHYGGPVRPRTAFVLHSPDYADPGTVRISPELSMSGSAEIMHGLANGKGPRRAMLMLGHAGWRPGQLAAEISERYWVVVPAGTDLVFGPGHGDKWLEALKRRGIDL